jgi:hypothetical protein
MRTGPYFAAACFAIFFSVFLPGHVLLAQDQDKPAVAPLAPVVSSAAGVLHFVMRLPRCLWTLTSLAPKPLQDIAAHCLRARLEKRKHQLVVRHD